MVRLSTTDQRFPSSRAAKIAAPRLGHACSSAHSFIRAPFVAVAGQSLVEFALTLPILLLLVFGGINGLQSAMTHYLVAWATREAANQAALDGGTGMAAQRMAHTILDNGITRADRAKIAIGCEGPCRRYQPITVAIEYSDSVWVPLGPWDTIAVTRRAVRASERDAVDTTAAPADAAKGTTDLPGRPESPQAPVPGTAAVPGSAP